MSLGLSGPLPRPAPAINSSSSFAPRQSGPFPRRPTSRPLGGPSTVPPAGIAPGAGSPSRPGLRPAPDFPRSDFSSTNEGERKNARLPRAGPEGTPAWPCGRGRQGAPARPVSAVGRCPERSPWPQAASSVTLGPGLQRRQPPASRPQETAPSAGRHREGSAGGMPRVRGRCPGCPPWGPHKRGL